MHIITFNTHDDVLLTKTIELDNCAVLSGKTKIGYWKLYWKTDDTRTHEIQFYETIIQWTPRSSVYTEVGLDSVKIMKHLANGNIEEIIPRRAVGKSIWG